MGDREASRTSWPSCWPKTGCDFRYYKKSTTLRRIERRMGLHRIADLAQYCDLLRRDAKEVGQLVAGCASGEEAYAVALLLVEEVAAAGKRCAVQVFATDIDEEALRFARVGSYPESLVADVGDERLARFFVRQGPPLPGRRIAPQVGGLCRP
jgi:two-component system CheB/CheR fusion protein